VNTDVGQCAARMGRDRLQVQLRDLMLENRSRAALTIGYGAVRARLNAEPDLGYQAMYGLRFFDRGSEVRLLQLADGGQVRLQNVRSGRVWWSKPPRGVVWEVHETLLGLTCRQRAEAEAVKASLEQRGG
jgi:hypothetical protein